MDFRNSLDQRFFDLTKDFDMEDWRELRDEHYWWTEDPQTGAKIPRDRIDKLDLIAHYVRYGRRKNS